MQYSYLPSWISTFVDQGKATEAGAELFNAVDPVTFWSFDMMWREPEWMDHPRGYDVSDRGQWFPFVTWRTPGVFDLMAGFGAPPGFGRDFRLDHFNGWAQVALPHGWREPDTRRLEQHLHQTD